MDLSQEIINILKDIEAILPEMPYEELGDFSYQWEQVDAVVNDYDSVGDSYIEEIKAAVNASSFLKSQGFSELLNQSVSRFGNQPLPTGKEPIKGLPPIHNEVIRIGKKVKALLK